MSNDRKEETGGMDPGDDEALWRLLGRARNTEVSPYFSRRVLREVAQSGQKGRVSAGIGDWLAGLRRALRRPGAAVWPGAAVVAAFWLAVVVTTPAPAPGHATHRLRHDVPSAEEQTARVAPTLAANDPAMLATATDDVAPQDVEVIADLDNLITREENRLWIEDTARF